MTTGRAAPLARPVASMDMLDLSADGVQLTAALVDVPSVSGDERALADAVEAALRGCAAFDVERDGNVVVARTRLGQPRRVALAGHLDTVPIADNLPSHLAEGRLFGCGTSDMKSGVAVALRVAAFDREGRAPPNCGRDLDLLRLRGGRSGA